MQVSQANFPSTNWISQQKLLIVGVVTFIGLAVAFHDEVYVDPATVLAFGYLAVFILPMIASTRSFAVQPNGNSPFTVTRMFLAGT